MDTIFYDSKVLSHIVILLRTALVQDGAASLFRWSADGKYLARKGKDLISIYELPSMRLLDKKSLKVRSRILFIKLVPS